MAQITRRQFLKSAAGALATSIYASGLFLPQAYAQDGNRTYVFGHFRVRCPESVPQKRIQEFMGIALGRYESLARYLGRRYRGNILIDIGDYPAILADIELGKIEIPLENFLRRKTSIIHELTHLLTDYSPLSIVMPSPGKIVAQLTNPGGSGGAMHGEGIAVSMQERFGWEDVHGKYENLDQYAASFRNPIPIEDLDVVTDFNLIQFYWPLEKIKMAYVQSGSIVGFLIRDLLGDPRKYMMFYEEGFWNLKNKKANMFPYERYFGMSRKELESRWLNVLEHYRKQNSTP